VVGVVERGVGDPLAHIGHREWFCDADSTGEHVDGCPVCDGDVPDDLGFPSGDSYGDGDSVWAGCPGSDVDVVGFVVGCSGGGCDDVGECDVEHGVGGVVECGVGDSLAYDGQWECCCDVDGSGQYGHGCPVCDGDLPHDFGFSSGDSYGVGDPSWTSGSGSDVDVVGFVVGCSGGWCDDVGECDVEHGVGGVVECGVGDLVAYDGQWECCCDVDGSGQYGHGCPVCDGDLPHDLGFSSGDSYAVGDSAWACRRGSDTGVVWE